MNSLVVFLSVVAFAVAKPSGILVAPGAVAYSAPIIATAIPAAVSHQSRLDIKSSPAVVATAAVAPVARTVIAQPTLLAAPGLATVGAAAVSSQSRIDIKTSPEVTSTVISAAPIAPAVAYNAALAYNTPITYSAPISYSAPILTSAIAPTIVKTAIATPAVPHETPEVVAARAAHLEAKVQALAGAHLIHKRSAPVIAAPFVSTAYASTYGAAPLVSTYHSGPVVYSAPVALSTPLLTKAYSVHPW